MKKFKGITFKDTTVYRYQSSIIAEDCVFRNVDFIGVELSNIHFKFCRFYNCTFDWDSHLMYCKFYWCDFYDCVSEAYMSYTQLIGNRGVTSTQPNYALGS